MLRRILVCCMAAVAACASAGCQLIMEELEEPVDAGSDASEADNDATIPGSSDADTDATGAPLLDASEVSDAASPDAEAGMLPFDAGAPDANPPACDGAGSRVFFEDGDDDGYGNPSSFEVACTAPAHHVSTGGDCNDENASVHPDQTDFFGEGYRIPGSGLVSFDFDCDDEEVAGPGQDLASAQGCQGLLPCTGAGYLKAARRDVRHANDYCGSRTILSCAALLVCTGGQQSTTDTPYVCH
jgi:hypothetical protein